jgi:hypothetical protein
MDSVEIPDVIFANRVIRQFVDHLCGEDLVTSTQDFAAIRNVFRRCRGNWEALVSGSMLQLSLLEKVIAAWSKMPTRTRTPKD